MTRKRRRAQERKAVSEHSHKRKKRTKMELQGSKLYCAGKCVLCVILFLFFFVVLVCSVSFLSLHLFSLFFQWLFWCVPLSPSMLLDWMIYWREPLSFQTSYTPSARLSPMTWSVPVLFNVPFQFNVNMYLFLNTRLTVVRTLTPMSVSTTGLSLPSCWQDDDAASVHVSHILPPNSQWQRSSPENSGTNTLYYSTSTFLFFLAHQQCILSFLLSPPSGHFLWLQEYKNYRK